MSSSTTTKQSSYCGNQANVITEHAKPQDAKPHSGESYAVRKKHCLKEGVLYEDPDFPAIDSSLFYSKKPPRPFQWKRPKDIVNNPSLFVGGASRFDITQGMLGDCWLLAAVATLCQYEDLLMQVVPHDQSFEKDQGYCGIFRFRFWQYGKWEEVVVDDRLPTYNNKLVFLHSSQNNEFWSALLEKAYAKLCGTYEALKGGQTSEAMEDFTGGVTETFQIAKMGPDFFKTVSKAQDRQSLMCCSIEAKPTEIEAKLDNGLIKGHAYSVTGVTQVKVKDKDVELLRIRNPWGNAKEWNGAWSDDSGEWKDLSDAQKKAMMMADADDGEFWMSNDDYTKNFTKLEICMLSPDSAGDSTAKKWAMEIHQGSWQSHVTAGGCRNFPDTFHLNPQYRITLEDPDDDNDVVDECTIIIGLIQKGRRKQKRVGSQNLTIGFSFYKLEDDHHQYVMDGRLTKDFFLYHKSHAKSANFVNGREVTGRFSFVPGEYVIIPSTFKANEEGDFILRIFSEKPQTSSVSDCPTKIELKPRTYTQVENDKFDEKFKKFFSMVAGEDGEIDAFELQTVVNAAFKKELEGKEFSLEACRSMLSMEDRDRNGKLDYDEFRDLWRTIMAWKTNFKEFDTDGSGDFSSIELREALSKLGFKLSTAPLSSIVLRYAQKNGNVSLDDYIQICCRVKSTFEAYCDYQGKQFSLDDYIMAAIYT